MVANEVKNLANQTAKATDEIATQIDAIQSLTGEAAGGVETASTNSATVANAAEETGEAAREVLNSATDLIEQSATLRMQIDLFLDRVRAA